MERFRYFSGVSRHFSASGAPTTDQEPILQAGWSWVSRLRVPPRGASGGARAVASAAFMLAKCLP